jgi:pimeloyl-ACP methyl ester carboxylesterase
VTPAAALSLALAGWPQAASEPSPSRATPQALRYDLRPGDHLVYRQCLERGLRSASVDSRSEAEWESHVLVLAERGGAFRVGIQRNRTRADLLRHREHGRDRLEKERPPFAEALAKRGVASLMGGGLPFFERGDAIDAAAIARIPFLFVHGDRDEVIPDWASRRTVTAIRKANPAAVAELHVLPGRRHDVVWGREEGLTFPFLQRHARDPFPRRVSLRTRSLDHPRAFWVEVLEKAGSLAEVDGTIEGQAIALRTKNVKRLRLLLRRDLVDLKAPVRVTIGGREAFAGPVVEDPSLLLRSWRETGDPQLAHAAEIVLEVQ